VYALLLGEPPWTRERLEQIVSVPAKEEEPLPETVFKHALALALLGKKEEARAELARGRQIKEKSRYAQDDNYPEAIAAVVHAYAGDAALAKAALAKLNPTPKEPMGWNGLAAGHHANEGSWRWRADH